MPGGKHNVIVPEGVLEELRAVSATLGT